ERLPLRRAPADSRHAQGRRATRLAGRDHARPGAAAAGRRGAGRAARMSGGPAGAGVGVGGVGLPPALFLAGRGGTRPGLAPHAAQVATIRAGRMPFREDGGQTLLDRHLGTRFLPTEDLAAVARVETIVVTLGTPVDEHNNPIYLPIENLVRSMLPHLHAGHLLVLRSTVSPGTPEHL